MRSCYSIGEGEEEDCIIFAELSGGEPSEVHSKIFFAISCRNGAALKQEVVMTQSALHTDLQETVERITAKLDALDMRLYSLHMRFLAHRCETQRDDGERSVDDGPWIVDSEA